jgi:hypothetical protein
MRELPVGRVRTISSKSLVAALLVVSLATPAFSAVINKHAQLREGPSRFSAPIAWVDAGTAVDILGDQSGWVEVMLPDGRRGFVWGEHVDGGTDSPPSTEGAAKEPAGSPRTLQEEIHELRADLDRLRSDGTVARREDIDRLAARIDALTQTHRELTSLIEASSPAVATPVDGSAVAAGTFLTIGLIVGWIAARFTQGRRDRRSRIRV